MNIDRIIRDAKSAPTKQPLNAYRDAIATLREKGYSWREIAEFLTERGVKTDHTKLYRMFKQSKSRKGKSMKIPTSEQYLEALKSIDMTPNQKKMLKEHYDALNRTITYTELADAAEYENHGGANLQYGDLAKKIGDAIGFEYAETENRPGKKFHGSAIGMANSYPTGENFELLMHHELAKAIAASGMFD
jgi:hypothetical protein